LAIDIIKFPKCSKILLLQTYINMSWFFDKKKQIIPYKRVWLLFQVMPNNDKSAIHIYNVPAICNVGGQKKTGTLIISYICIKLLIVKVKSK
jgi:hypothetical protein